MYKREGLAALWRGNLVNVIRYVPTQAFNFAFMDVNKKLLPRYNPVTDRVKFTLMQILSGGLAGSLSLVFVYPFDFARTRLSADLGTSKNREYQGLRDLFKKIYKTDGIKGFYRGFVLSLSFSFVYRGAYLGLYGASKEVLFNKPSLFVRFIAAQCITVLAGVIVYPIDTVRRRLMM